MLYPSHFYSNMHTYHPHPSILSCTFSHWSYQYVWVIFFLIKNLPVFGHQYLVFPFSTKLGKWLCPFYTPLGEWLCHWINIIPLPIPTFLEGGVFLVNVFFLSQIIVLYLTVDPHNVAGSSTSPDHKGPRQFHWLGYLTIAKLLQKKNIQLHSNNTKVNSLFGVNLVTIIF